MAATPEAVLPDHRTLSEVILKSIAIHAATIIAVGHLTSIRRLPKHVQNYEVIGFIIMPTLPIAQLIVELYRSLKDVYYYGQVGDWGYYISACLGIHAVPRGGDPESGVNLRSLDPRSLNRVPEKRDLRWAARIVVLLIFILQDCLVLVLWARRIAISGRLRQKTDIPTYFISKVLDRTDSILDQENALFAAGGLVAGLSTLVIEVLNWTWYFPVRDEPPMPEGDKHRNWCNLIPYRRLWTNLNPSSLVFSELQIAQLLLIPLSFRLVMPVIEISWILCSIFRTMITSSDVLLSIVGIYEIVIIVLGHCICPLLPLVFPIIRTMTLLSRRLRRTQIPSFFRPQLWILQLSLGYAWYFKLCFIFISVYQIWLFPLCGRQDEDGCRQVMNIWWKDPLADSLWSF